jgi:hypothetical protein
VRVDVADPPEVKVTLVGLSDVVGPPNCPDGLTLADKLRVPLKLLRLLSVIVDVAELPIRMVKLVGLADMLKSPPGDRGWTGLGTALTVGACATEEFFSVGAGPKLGT